MLTFTEQFADVIKKAQERKQEIQGLMLRISIKDDEDASENVPNIGFEFESRPPGTSDSVIDEFGIKVVLDEKTAKLLENSTIDYSREEKFTISFRTIN